MNKVTLLAAAAGTLMAAPALAAITGVVNNIPGTFVNIEGMGGATMVNTVNASNDDCQYSAVMPFTNAEFANSPMRICSNGFVQFGGTAGSTTFGNASIPANGVSILGGRQTLMPFWDDMVADNRSSLTSNSKIQWLSASAASLGLPAGLGNVLIIQWTRMDLFGILNPQNATFQVQIFQNPLVDAGSGQTAHAQYLYQNTVFGPNSADPGFANNNGKSATVGYYNGAAVTGGTQGSAGSSNAQWSFNTESVFSGNVLSLVPAPGAAALLGMGVVMVGRRRR